MRLARTGRLAALLPEYERRDFTYSEVGATRGAMPAGYHHTHFRRAVGQGDNDLHRAAEVVMAWDMQRGSGMKVAVDGPAVDGRTVVMAIGAPLGLVVPCRVVYVVDEPTRRGFGYGTLPGHPECGEESFVASLDGDGKVWLEITAFSRPGSRLIALAGPLNRIAQQIALRAYARSARRQVVQ